MNIKVIYQILLFNLIVLILLSGSKLNIYYLENATLKKISIIDEVINYQAAVNYIVNKDFSITHPYSKEIGKDGKKYSKHPIGMVFFSIIFGKIGLLINKYVSKYFVVSTNIFLTGLIALVMYNFLYYICNEYKKSLYLTLLLIFGTPILYYSKTLFTQIPYTLGICLFILGLYKLTIEKRNGEVWIGLGLALSIISREEAFIFIVPCFIILSIEYIKKKFKTRKPFNNIFFIFNWCYTKLCL